MNEPLDIILITPDHGNNLNNFPWGVLSIGSYLVAHGKKVALLDASMMSDSEFRAELADALPRANIVGICCFSTDTVFVKALIDRIKDSKTDIKVIVGGPHAVLLPEQTCAYRNIDFVASGEGERTTERLIEEIGKPEPRWDSVPGLLYKDASGMPRRGLPPEPVGPYGINYDLFPERTRKSFGEYMQVLSGRGCSYRCTFCYNSVVGQKFQPRPVADFMAEIEKLVTSYNPKVIYFRDENFFQDKERIREFVRIYQEKGFKFRWRATCRANYFRDDYLGGPLLAELKKTNCELLKMGLESGSQRILKFLKKGLSVEDSRNAADKLAGAGLKGNFSFIAGLPTQTMQEHIETLELIKYIIRQQPNADIIGPQYYRLYPGGVLYDNVLRDYGVRVPQSFEEWAANDDPLGLGKGKDHPWLPPEVRLLARYGDILVLLYRKPWHSFLRLRWLPFLFFVVLGKLRIKFNFYRYLYDIQLFSIVYFASYSILRKMPFLKGTAARDYGSAG